MCICIYINFIVHNNQWKSFQLRISSPDNFKWYQVVFVSLLIIKLSKGSWRVDVAIFLEFCFVSLHPVSCMCHFCVPSISNVSGLSILGWLAIFS